ncbi:MAG TPA: DUF975 family protein [Candidatus Intestinimonas stercoravium]|uniref:DUF975 family protein n=1 Tax=uncultured Intestinimonas sp. TaxID=1689265 RepID=UPI001F9A79C7|nr:DUF975 family protein [uncultured Intestinimonas sp.]HJA64396.1 DUF975 family protein [Candidatus Intestinimonas stercoravium]
MRPTFSRRALKQQAKQTFFRYLRPCLAAACLLMLISVLTQVFSQATGGSVMGLLLRWEDYPMETGLWVVSADTMLPILSIMGLERLGGLGGVVFSLASPESGVVMVVPMGWLQLVNLVLVHVVVFLVTVPLQYGALSQFHYVLLGQPRPFRALLDWYLDLRLTAKALAAQVLLALWRGATSALCLLPSLACLLAGTVMSSAPLLSLSFPLLLLGLGAGYFCYLQLLPAQYLLAQRPQLGLGDAFSRAWRLLKGQRFSFFLLDLSFLPWYIVSLFLWGIADLFILPYVSLTNLLCLDALEDRV